MMVSLDSVVRLSVDPERRDGGMRVLHRDVNVVVRPLHGYGLNVFVAKNTELVK